MIIKFEVNGAWQLFDDVDSLMYRKLGNFSVNIDDMDGVIDYTGTVSLPGSGSEGHPGRVLLTFMNSKQLAESQVIAFSPVYLMNADGRTVETI